MTAPDLQSPAAGPGVRSRVPSGSAIQSKSGQILGMNLSTVPNPSRIKTKIQTGMEQLKISRFVHLCRPKPSSTLSDIFPPSTLKSPLLGGEQRSPCPANQTTPSTVEQLEVPAPDWSNYAELSSSPPKPRAPSTNTSETSAGVPFNESQYVNTSRDLLFTVRHVEDDSCAEIASTVSGPPGQHEPVKIDHYRTPAPRLLHVSSTSSPPNSAISPTGEVYIPSPLASSSHQRPSFSVTTASYTDDGGTQSSDDEDDLLESPYPLPPGWNDTHDRMICQLDVQPDISYRRIVSILRGTFPVLRDERMNGNMIENRLRCLDQMGERCDYWKIAMEISDENRARRRPSKLKAKLRDKGKATMLPTGGWGQNSKQTRQEYIRLPSSPWSERGEVFNGTPVSGLPSGSRPIQPQQTTAKDSFNGSYKATQAPQQWIEHSIRTAQSSTHHSSHNYPAPLIRANSFSVRSNMNPHQRREREPNTPRGRIFDSIHLISSSPDAKSQSSSPHFLQPLLLLNRHQQHRQPSQYELVLASPQPSSLPSTPNADLAAAASAAQTLPRPHSPVWTDKFVSSAPQETCLQPVAFDPNSSKAVKTPTKKTTAANLLQPGSVPITPLNDKRVRMMITNVESRSDDRTCESAKKNNAKDECRLDEERIGHGENDGKPASSLVPLSSGVDTISTMHTSAQPPTESHHHQYHQPNHTVTVFSCQDLINELESPVVPVHLASFEQSPVVKRREGPDAGANTGQWDHSYSGAIAEIEERTKGEEGIDLKIGLKIREV